jgi:DNA-directed RNA polymerase subunit RPC12/RpoP
MSSRFLNLHCSQCGIRVIRYRKEGSGRLIRVYLDRITEPENLRSLKHAAGKPGLPPLVCPGCGQRIGVSIIRGLGNRPAYRLIQGSFRKKEV